MKAQDLFSWNKLWPRWIYKILKTDGTNRKLAPPSPFFPKITFSNESLNFERYIVTEVSKHHIKIELHVYEWKLKPIFLKLRTHRNVCDRQI